MAFYLPTLGPLIEPGAALPFAGGAEHQIWLLARGLARRGFAVCVVVEDTAGGLPARRDGVDIAIRPHWEGGGGVRGWAAELRAVWGTLGPLRTRVVVQRAAGRTTGLVAAITRAKRRAFVYSSANIVDFNYEQLAFSRRDLWLFELGVRLANQIVVQTREQAAQCASKFGRNATVIRSIAEPASAATRSPEAFLWIGRLVSYKHPEAFVALARALPEARFQLVGLGSGADPTTQERVERAARGLPNLELLATRPRAELMPLYDRAVAVVNTADWEGMPNTFLEGWARGVPALALSHDPDGVIEGERLGAFASGSEERLVALARELWASRDHDAPLARRCVEYVRREHDAEHVIDGWADALGLQAPLAPAPARAPSETSAYAGVQ